MKSIRKIVLIIFGAIWIIVNGVTFSMIGDYHILDDDITMAEVTFGSWVQNAIFTGLVVLLLVWICGLEDKDIEEKKTRKKRKIGN